MTTKYAYVALPESSSIVHVRILGPTHWDDTVAVDTGSAAFYVSKYHVFETLDEAIKSLK